MARTGLGRGLDVLLGQAPAASSPPLQPVGASEIPLERIHPNPQQPRSNFDPEGIAELAASPQHAPAFQLCETPTPSGCTAMKPVRVWIETNMGLF